VRQVLDAARASIAARGLFKFVLAGGSTPQRAYRRLAAQDCDWRDWRLYFGDERCLPAGHADRNSTMASAAWLQAAGFSDAQVFPIPAEQGPAAGADAYEPVIRDALPFDLVLLGMGEDGHTASLFPGDRHDPERLAVPVSDAPKPPPERVSLNYGALGNSRRLLVLVTGAGKREALRRWKAGEPLPVAQLNCAAGIDVLIDEAAWCE
jgi:6-phosphogluconolactonase